jgi:hypothetical protein
MARLAAARNMPSVGAAVAGYGNSIHLDRCEGKDIIDENQLQSHYLFLIIRNDEEEKEKLR